MVVFEIEVRRVRERRVGRLGCELGRGEGGVCQGIMSREGWINGNEEHLNSNV